ncbi:DUF6153 family protein [uncultured Microbacterium sp.]|uniref:DUF6153 family protein n=1 Tax=uncultured Microbacterium sp. TaxID=191216 RepID=UPI00263938BF|nr:DUF6153 family protein [uncultured Microbacterium sp.]
MLAPSQIWIRRPQPVRWLIVACLAAMVILGLMGMHTLSVGHSDPMPTAGMTAMTEHGSPESGVAVSPASGVGGGHEQSNPCVGCGGGEGHDAAMMVCVLALLGSLLLILVPLSTSWRVRVPDLRLRGLRPHVPQPSKPPSLVELSISRT